MNRKYTYDNTPMPNIELDDELKQINPICLDILYKRGYTTNEQMRELLFPSASKAIQSLNCRDIDRALNIMASAVTSQAGIVVYHDYDVDGITAGALAVGTLRNLGATVNHYANSRADGFGLCKNGIDNIMKKWPQTKLIITVDNGISSIEGVEYAKEKGLSVVITDHHMPNVILPAADAIIDMKRTDETYPYKDFCGCGLIFRVMLDLYRKLNKNIEYVMDYLDLVALATVADVVPLIGDNRYYVKEGLKLIESGKRTFFRIIAVLYEVTEFSAHYTLAYRYAPVLNSLSRMNKNTSVAIEMLLSSDAEWVEAEMLKLKDNNQQRKDITQGQYEAALGKIGDCTNKSALVVYDKDFAEGVIGIISGRLKDKFYRPVIVFAPANNGVLKGSGRSLDDFNLKEALDKLSPLLLKYGGHAKAAGLSIKEENLDKFTQAFNDLAAAELKGKKNYQEIPLAAVLDDKTLTTQLVQDLRILEPYGEGFPEPVFGLKLQCDTVRYMGASQQHVKLTSKVSDISVIIWNKGAVMKARSTLPYKFIGKPNLNVWNGETQVQFIQNDAA